MPSEKIECQQSILAFKKHYYQLSPDITTSTQDVAIITGATSSFGVATALRFAKRKCQLVITGRNMEKLENTREMCINAGLDETEVIAVAADLDDQFHLQTLVDLTISKFGKLSILVNNAVMPEVIDEEEESCEANIPGLLQLTQLCLPYLRESKGTIINNSVILAHFMDLWNFKQGLSKILFANFDAHEWSDVSQESSAPPGSSDIEVGVSGNTDPIVEHLTELLQIFLCSDARKASMEKNSSHPGLCLKNDQLHFDTNNNSQQWNKQEAELNGLGGNYGCMFPWAGKLFRFGRK